MHVLFVSRAKAGTGISPIVKKQGESLEEFVMISYLLIGGKGICGYLKGIMKIRAYAGKNDIDIIHAHYSLSGITAALSCSRPVVCSLMGSDIQAGPLMRFLIRFFARYCWKTTIVKSERMKQEIGLKHARVLPNGVDMELFRPIDRSLAMQKAGFDPRKKHILFLADPARPEKNFRLAEEAFKLLGSGDDLALHAIHGVDHSTIPYYLNAADVLVITSLWEGSPNAVKEAMACNCPVVSTDVGDVKQVVEDTIGCYISNFNPEEFAKKISMTLKLGKRTSGRENIQDLNDKIIAEKILLIYLSIQ